MIDPPIIFTEEGSESRRDSTQKQITRTTEEIEQRRLHHLFAQNAVCALSYFECRFLILFSYLFYFHID